MVGESKEKEMHTAQWPDTFVHTERPSHADVNIMGVYYNGTLRLLLGFRSLLLYIK
jgi:hypothetical protein